MKDFVKWLGVNEKIAKVIVWLLIIMVFLILTNTLLESVGFPHYAITYDNLKRINVNQVVNDLSSCLVNILNFYAISLLVFRIKESKKLFKYAILYLILTWVVASTFNYAISQIFIFLYFITFCYFYSQKNYKYITYSIIAVIIDAIIQGITYMHKARLIDISRLNQITKNFLSIDYFIIIGVIILVKEIYLKKRSEKNNEVT